jgi:hypothetical protein
MVVTTKHDFARTLLQRVMADRASTSATRAPCTPATLNPAVIRREVLALSDTWAAVTRL